MLASAFAEAGLAYLTSSLLLSAVHHIRYWTQMSATLTAHGLWHERVRVPVQITLTCGEAIVASLALWALLASDVRLMQVTFVVALPLAAAFLAYVSVLERSGVHVPCGCYFIGRPELYDRPNHVPALALVLVSGVGLMATCFLNASTPEGLPMYLAGLRTAVILALGVSATLLVQVLGVLKMGPLSRNGIASPTLSITSV